MATNIGEAFIRVHADTTPFRRELKKEGDRLAEESGRSAAAKYRKEWSQELDKIAETDLENFRRKLRVATTRRDFSNIAKQMGGVENAAKAINDELETMVNHQLLNKNQAKQVRSEFEKWAAPIRAANAEAAKAEAAARKVADEEKKVTKERADQERLGRFLARETEARLRALGREVELVRFITSHRTDIDVDRRNRLLVAAGRLRTIEGLFSRISDRVGRIFGARSRNDFLNVIGRVIDALVGLPGTVVGAIGSALSLLDGFFRQIQTSANNIQDAFGKSFIAGIEAIGGELATPVVGVVVALATIGVLMDTIAIAAGILASALSLLAGIATAFASALAFAAGGLLALGPALLSLAPAVAVVFGLFQDFNKLKTDKQFAKTHPQLVKLKNAFNGVGSAVDVAINKTLVPALAALAPVLKNFWTPLVAGTATAMATILTDLGRLLNSPQIRGFLNIWKKALPGLLVGIGLGVNRLLVGVLAFFTPLLPFANRLITAFDKLAQKFLTWATSAKGQRSIHDFMVTAFTDAKKVADIIGHLLSIIGKLFGLGETTGQGFLTTLDDLVTRFDHWLSTTEGKNAVAQWFRDASRFAGELGDLITAIVDVFHKLDSPENRQALGFIIEGFTALVTVIGGVLNFIEQLPGRIGGFFGEVKDFVLSAVGFFNETNGLFQTIPTLIGTAIGNIAKTLLGFFTGLPEQFRTLLNPILGVFGQWGSDIVSTIMGALLFLPTQIAQVLGPQLVTAFGAAFGPIVGVVGGVFSTLLATISGWLGRIGTAIQGAFTSIVANAPGWIGGIVAGVGTVFSNVWSTVSGWLGRVRTAVSRGLTGIVSGIAGWLAGLVTAIAAPFREALRVVSGIVGTIERVIAAALAAARAAAAGIAAALPGIGPLIPHASGALVMGPQRALIGEAGPEAVVPLNRPLSLVDPSVRALSALAQGLPMAGGGVVGGGKTIIVQPGAIVVTSTAADPENVARAVLDRLTAAAF